MDLVLLGGFQIGRSFYRPPTHPPIHSFIHPYRMEEMDLVLLGGFQIGVRSWEGTMSRFLFGIIADQEGGGGGGEEEEEEEMVGEGGSGGGGGGGGGKKKKALKVRALPTHPPNPIHLPMSSSKLISTIHPPTHPPSSSTPLPGWALG